MKQKKTQSKPYWLIGEVGDWSVQAPDNSSIRTSRRTDHYHRSNMYKMGYRMGRMVGKMESAGIFWLVTVGFMWVGIMLLTYLIYETIQRDR